MVDVLLTRRKVLKIDDIHKFDYLPSSKTEICLKKLHQLRSRDARLKSKASVAAHSLLNEIAHEKRVYASI